MTNRNNEGRPSAPLKNCDVQDVCVIGLRADLFLSMPRVAVYLNKS